ncbi:hypothetical protein DFH11DRAFT_78278 [Phellopilus nigrolimitatus]|nr:hypothetical protein DFH11DRAFT_78278 [Phellopilus nigrolimitatus]
MCYLLYSKRSEFKRTRSIIRTLIHFTMATGVFTSFMTTAYIISFYTMKTNMVYIGIYFVHGKVYLNSMLAALNSRVSLREMANQDTMMSFYSTSELTHGTTSRSFSSGSRERIELRTVQSFEHALGVGHDTNLVAANKASFVSGSSSSAV